MADQTPPVATPVEVKLNKPDIANITMVLRSYKGYNLDEAAIIMGLMQKLNTMATTASEK